MVSLALTLSLILALVMALNLVSAAWHAEGVHTAGLMRHRVLVLLSVSVLASGLWVTRWILSPYGLRWCAVEDRMDTVRYRPLAVDRYGRYIGPVDAAQGRFISLDSFNTEILLLFLGLEDHRFYQRDSGIDVYGIIRAAFRNVVYSEKQGASTIDMHVIRSLCGHMMPPDGTAAGKFSEAGAAWYLSHRLTRNQILEIYINTVYLGRNRYGIDAAAREYFGVPAEELRITEAAQLSALIPNPARFDPARLGSQEARNIRANVLSITARRFPEHASVLEGAADAGIRLSPSRTGSISALEWFVRTAHRQAVVKGFTGDTLFTTLDLDLQRAAEQELNGLEKGIRSGKYGPFEDRKSELLLFYAALDGWSSEVLAYVPGPPAKGLQTDWIAQAWITLSSTIKPLLYGLALQHAGVRPGDSIQELETACSSLMEHPWIRRLRRPEGLETIEDVLVLSDNVGAACLLELIPNEALTKLHALGFSSPDPNHPADALGTQRVHALDLLRMYAAFGNGGVVLREAKFSGPDQSQRESDSAVRPDGEPLFEPEVANQVERALEEVVRRGTGKRIRRFLDDSYTAAGKTGTGVQFLWVGTSNRVVSLVWVGREQPQRITVGSDAGEIAAPAWARIMAQYHSRRNLEGRNKGAAVW